MITQKMQKLDSIKPLIISKMMNLVKIRYIKSKKYLRKKGVNLEAKVHLIIVFLIRIIQMKMTQVIFVLFILNKEFLILSRKQGN